MAFHPAVFNVTVLDPSLYHGVPGSPHPLFHRQHHHQAFPRFPGVPGIPGAPEVPGVPGSHLASVPGFPGGHYVGLPGGVPVGVPGIGHRGAPGGVPGGLPSQYLDLGQEDPHFQSFVHSLPSELQGPVAFRNTSGGRGRPGPVVPRLAIPTISNSTFLQLPVLWTALSLALGVEVQGQLIRGLPCIMRLNQLFCRTPGNSYPSDKIEQFIDDNKALMRRMYGSFLDNLEASIQQSFQRSQGSGRRRGRSVGKADVFVDEIPELHQHYHAEDPRGESFFNLIRRKRQSFPGNANSNSDRTDSCESKVEIVTPYWANNSAGKIRAIVNNKEFSQAIHQEVCTKQGTKRCSGDCGCEQKYKWHRLLAYDPENDCSGIFMDWFLFPSCCSCRCDPL